MTASSVLRSAPRPSLSEQLATFYAAMLQRMAPGDCDALCQGEQAMAAATIRPLAAGDAAPGFTLPDQHGRPVRLADRLALGPVVLLFYRGGWCPFCSLALRAWQDALPALQDAGGDLLAISPQLAPVCTQTAERDLLAFPVLSDAGGAVGDLYGVNYDLPPAASAVYARLGHDVPRINGDGRWRLPLPSTFVVSPEDGGRILLADAARTMAHRLEPAAAIAALQRHA